MSESKPDPRPEPKDPPKDPGIPDFSDSQEKAGKPGGTRSK
jgi:hypothetical protein